MQMRQRDVAAPDAKYTKELADAKAENDVLCVMMLPLVVVGCTSKQSVSQRSYHASGVDNAASPDWQTPLNGIISPPERLITMQKQLEGTQKYINECDRVAHIDGQLMQLL